MDIIKHMKHAISLAEKGTQAFPNPKVGALIIKNNEVVASGYHQVYGGPHAEVDAFNHLKESAEGLTMVVTLEPCSHHGKTPPCVDLIIEKGISKVIIGMQDPNPLVAGKGIEKLQHAGIEVEVGFFEEELTELNKMYLTNVQKNRPFTTLKVAMTVDGKIASKTYDSKWISHPSSRLKTHELRNRHQAILVSVNTILRDDPSLSVRLDDIKHPFKIVIDPELKTPITAKIIQEDASKVILITQNTLDHHLLQPYQDLGVQIMQVASDGHHLHLQAAFEKLFHMELRSIFIEAGHHLSASLFQASLIDELVVFIAPKLIGGDTAPTLMGGEGIAWMNEAIKLSLIQHERFNEDIMLQYKVRHSPCLQD